MTIDALIFRETKRFVLKSLMLLDAVVSYTDLIRHHLAPDKPESSLR